jgi:hypothetical protein
LYASNAKFSELHKKIDEATLFLPSNEKELIRLRDFPGVEGISLDFGIEERDVPAQREAFPPELLFPAWKGGNIVGFHAPSISERVTDSAGPLLNRYN